MSAAYAVICKKTRTIRMDQHTKALAIFDTREAAREIARRHKGASTVAPVLLKRPQKTEN